MRVLGIDPALNNTGWAIIESFSDSYNVLGVGHISNKNNENYYDKLARNFQCVDELIKNYKPDVLAVEETFVNVNAVSSLKLSIIAQPVLFKAGSIPNTLINNKYLAVKQGFEPWIQILVRITS